MKEKSILLRDCCCATCSRLLPQTAFFLGGGCMGVCAWVSAFFDPEGDAYSGRLMCESDHISQKQNLKPWFQICCRGFWRMLWLMSKRTSRGQAPCGSTRRCAHVSGNLEGYFSRLELRSGSICIYVGVLSGGAGEPPGQKGSGDAHQRRSRLQELLSRHTHQPWPWDGDGG